MKNAFTTPRVFKLGNSLAIVIPKQVWEDLKISDGDQYTVRYDEVNGNIVYSPYKKVGAP